MIDPTNIVQFRPGGEDWTRLFVEGPLAQKSRLTQDAYGRILRQFISFTVTLPGQGRQFQPILLTRTIVETYLAHLKDQGYSVTHRVRVKSVLRQFCQWLIDEQDIPLKRNPVNGVQVGIEQQQLAPRILSPDQRFVLKQLSDRSEDLRGMAIFALGYWAGCRVSDVAHLLMEHTHVGPKIGWLHVGHKGEKFRDIDLLNEARRPLHEYIQRGGREKESPYVFSSQRDEHLGERGIHYWFANLKRSATMEEWELVSDITFHDLRHDFAHRAREGGWSLEEIAYYLGHMTVKGTPAIQTTVRYTQVSREQVKGKLALLKG